MKINCFSVTFWFNIFDNHNDALGFLQNELSDEFAENIRAEKIYFENAGHFNKAAGYLKFEELFEMLK